MTLDLTFHPTSSNTAAPDTIQLLERLLDYLESDASGDFGCVVIPRIVAGYVLLGTLTHKTLQQICQERQGLSNPYPPQIICSAETESEWTWLQHRLPQLLQSAEITINWRKDDQTWQIQCRSPQNPDVHVYRINRAEADAEMITAILEVFRIILASNNLLVTVNESGIDDF